MTQEKRAVIICSQDAFANGVKPKELETYLKRSGFTSVIRFDSGKLSRLAKTGVRRLVPALHPLKMALYLHEAVLAVAVKMGGAACHSATSSLLWRIMVLRGKVLQTTLRESGHFDLLICESNMDQTVTLGKRVADVQILDLPSPFAEEMMFGGEFTQAGYDKLREVEVASYTAADYLSFHWHTYADYVRQKKYNGNNFLPITYGTHKKTLQARYSEQPRIIFLGYLGGYWVNLPLLSRLCKLYPNLDVYGGPEPAASLGINYKGYAPSTDVIAEYQFGLITISDDELRQHSFSSKHLEYISYGLPVLTPAWRQDAALDDSSIYYTADNFIEQVERASTREAWESLHAAALRDAARFSWDNALKALDVSMKRSEVWETSTEQLESEQAVMRTYP
ncbi:hypothetical protein [Caballeronia grimmiae]|uniref:Glycosyltransferase n=1 Tax=Caballeronia grimmiae TaxID=1071679 RepID=A0A069P596_9BURK|nr:hypothetical protein [Caballeronia grimmiae]KDR35738.1 hypothetical protein BG57_27565 [Caballeronia grimmiae]GGD82570.1 hypothetical protein GCM10010985_41300 [Caballeronia grimmiae]